MKKEIRAILKHRATVMAREPERKKAASAIIEVIVFTLAAETYAVESVFVREVFQLRDITLLPGVPVYVSGIINVHGQILPVIDLKKFFNLPEKGLGELNKVIILQNDQMEFGILADAILGIQAVDREDIQIVPIALPGIGEEYLKGVTRTGLIVLNAEKILSDKSIVVNSEVS